MREQPSTDYSYEWFEGTAETPGLKMEVSKGMQFNEQEVLTPKGLILLGSIINNLGMSKYMNQQYGQEKAKIMLMPLFCYYQKHLSTILTTLNKIWIVKSFWGFSRFKMHGKKHLEEFQTTVMTYVPQMIGQLNLKDIQALLEALSMYYMDINYDPTLA